MGLASMGDTKKSSPGDQDVTKAVEQLENLQRYVNQCFDKKIYPNSNPING